MLMTPKQNRVSFCQKWRRHVFQITQDSNRRKSQQNKHMSTNTDRLVGDLKRVVSDAEIILKDTASEIGDKARESRQRLLEAVEQAKASCHHLEEKALATARAADKTVRDHPYQSIAIAFGIGLLAGHLLTRK
jgi:ElaB/YqjD/DUF883 family membrane-anchored ribosome-binding protein